MRMLVPHIVHSALTTSVTKESLIFQDYAKISNLFPELIALTSEELFMAIQGLPLTVLVSNEKNLLL